MQQTLNQPSIDYSKSFLFVLIYYIPSTTTSVSLMDVNKKKKQKIPKQKNRLKQNQIQMGEHFL